MIRFSKITSLLCLIAILVFASATPVSNATTENEPLRRVKLHVLYDESYRYFFNGNGIEEAADRIRQMAELTKAPFKNIWNIELEYSFQRYEDLIGPSYATQCTSGTLWSYVEDPVTGRVTRVWDLADGDCTCTDYCIETDPEVLTHHNSAYKLLHLLRMNGLPEGKDELIGYFGHRLCYHKAGSDFDHVAGLTYHNLHYIVGLGTGSLFDSNGNLINDEYYLENLLSNARILQHELSHHYDLEDGQCTPNQACIMSGGFDGGIIYLSDLWCDSCAAKFNPSLVGSVVDGGN